MTKIASSALILSLLTFSATAGAQSAEAGFALDRFDPAERGSEWFANDSLDLRGHLRPALGLGVDYAYRPLVIFFTDAPDTVAASPVRDQLFLHVGGSVNLWSRLRLGADMPFALYQFGHSGVVDTPPPPRLYAKPAHEQALSDLRLGADVRLAGEYGDAATLAAGVQVYVPIGFRSDFTGDGTARLQPRVLLAGDLSAFVYAAKLGVMVRPHEAQYRNVSLGTEGTASVAAGLRVADKRLVIGPEVFASTVLNHDAFDKEATPVEGLLGAHYTAGDVRFGAGAGLGFTRGYGSPVSRLLASIEWAPRYEAPKEPIAPLPPPQEPPDRDRDRIEDARDACPDAPGVPTADPATNGCPPKPPPPPPPDRDHDSVLDDVDACPDTAGVASQDPKTNGCPPDPDRDKDGVPNDADACPDEAGAADPDPKKNGCPKAFVQAGQIKILEQVKFKTGSAEIQAKESDATLQAVVKVMTEHPEIKQVRVEGHTDNRGGAEMNRKLSKRRADAVVKWLTNHGIDKTRLAAEGFGPDRPIEDNTTDQGRAANRRVEFHIVQ
jgi:outer membrane protein OmpA-like peptidoglycan-associated protein